MPSKKQKKVDEIIRTQVDRYRWNYEEVRTDYLGYNSLSGPLAFHPEQELNEVYLRMAVKAKTKQEAARFSRLFPPLALNGPPTMSGFTGNSSPRSLLGMWSTLIPRDEVESHVKVDVLEV